MNNIFDTFGELFDSETGGVIGYDLGFRFAIYLNFSNMSLDFRMRFDEILDFDLILDSECLY
jgi:hypothetical protein